jgi:hypothetical protein
MSSATCSLTTLTPSLMVRVALAVAIRASSCVNIKAHITLILLHYTTSLTHREKKVPGTSELLIVSPMIPKCTVHNRYLNASMTVTVEGFEARSWQETIPCGAAASVSESGRWR